MIRQKSHKTLEIVVYCLKVSFLSSSPQITVLIQSKATRLVPFKLDWSVFFVLCARSQVSLWRPADLFCQEVCRCQVCGDWTERFAPSSGSARPSILLGPDLQERAPVSSSHSCVKTSTSHLTKKRRDPHKNWRMLAVRFDYETRQNSEPFLYFR